jgi:hypothetical protein
MPLANHRGGVSRLLQQFCHCLLLAVERLFVGR